MTIIAAIIDRPNRRAWMGSDSLATSGPNCSRVVSKITRLGAALVGTCGTPSGDRFLRRSCGALEEDAGHDGAERWVDAVTMGWRAWARDEHLADKDTGHVPWWATIATPWGLWHIGSDGSVIEIAEDYTAEGSGAGPALGVLWFIADRLGPVQEGGDERLRKAIAAAIAHGDGCGGEVRVEMVEASP